LPLDPACEEEPKVVARSVALGEKTLRDLGLSLECYEIKVRTNCSRQDPPDVLLLPTRCPSEHALEISSRRTAFAIEDSCASWCPTNARWTPRQLEILNVAYDALKPSFQEDILRIRRELATCDDALEGEFLRTVLHTWEEFADHLDLECTRVEAVECASGIRVALVPFGCGGPEESNPQPKRYFARVDRSCFATVDRASATVLGIHCN
jgi:hypothetical protein